MHVGSLQLYDLPEQKTLRLADGFKKVSLQGNDHRGGLLGDFNASLT